MSRIFLKFVFILISALLLNPLGASAEKLLLPEKSKLPKIWTADETAVTWGLLTGAAAFSLLDEPLRAKLQKSRSAGGDDVADGIAMAGHPAVTLGVSGLLWGVGKWQGNAHLVETGLLALEAMTLSQVGCVSLKVALGRKRPGPDDDAASFQPFSLRNDQHSFPSSHTASAFALASVLSERSTSTYAPFGYYGLATLVGLARLYQDEHWASDVVVGALFGELSARLVRNWHLRKNVSLTLGPYGGQGVGIVARMVW